MVNLQAEFITFHDAIKLDDGETLRQKRDILLNLLSKNIDSEAATYTHFNQGSYAMSTGIKPDNGDYDIDVGLKFDIDKDEHADPIQYKRYVRDALEGHTKSVTIRRSCVTVAYQAKGEQLYHVDFAIYSNKNNDGNMYIAKGKEFSDEDHKEWELSEPIKLMDTIRDKFEGNDRAQFRRIVRHMKKWKGREFANNGNGEPTGIGITILAYKYFDVRKSIDPYTSSTSYIDLTALRDFVQAVTNQFTYVWNPDEGEYFHQISVELPVEPYNELFEKMTPKQMETFYKKLGTILNTLNTAISRTKRSDACSDLVSIFGSDFPVTTDRSLVGTSESA